MKQIKEMAAEQIYLISGSSAANAAWFEKESDCKIFLKLADRYLPSYMEINGFQNDRDGWAMIITTKSEETIRAAYLKRRALSKKCKEGCAHDEIWRMLSDQIRIFLSTYVKSTNMDRNRVGGKVRGNYKRFVFESAEEALEMKERFAKHQFDLSQPEKCYRPSQSLYRVSKALESTSVYMSCGRSSRKEKVRELGLGCMKLVLEMTNVLRNLINSTLNHHFPALAQNSS